MKTIKCEQCGKKKEGYAMLYVVSEDAYFCGQECWDKYNGIERKQEK